MKKCLTICLLTFFLGGCAFFNSVQKNSSFEQNLATNREPSGIILSNHGSTIPENSSEILADLKIQGCDWVDNSKLIADYKLEQISHTILENQESLFGYSLIAILENVGICFTKNEFRSDIQKNAQIKIFKPQKYENKIVAINTGTAIIINKNLFQKMPFTSKQFLFLHEAAHSRVNTYLNDDLANSTEMQEASVQGLISKMENAVRNPKSVTPNSFVSQLTNGNFLYSEEELTKNQWDLKNWIKISNLVLNGFNEKIYNEFANSNTSQTTFNKNSKYLAGDYSFYSKLKKAYEIAQKWNSKVKHIELPKNENGFITKTIINGEVQATQRPYNDFESITITLNESASLKAKLYLLKSNEEINKYSLLNYIEYYDSFKPIGSSSILNSNLLSEIYVDNYSVNLQSILFVTDNKLYSFTPDLNNSKLTSIDFYKKISSFSFFKDRISEDFYVCKDNGLGCKTVGKINNNVITKAGKNKPYLYKENLEFFKISTGCFAVYSNYMSCYVPSEKGVPSHTATCLDYITLGHFSEASRLEFQLDLNTCKVITPVTNRY